MSKCLPKVFTRFFSTKHKKAFLTSLSHNLDMLLSIRLSNLKKKRKKTFLDLFITFISNEIEASIFINWLIL